MRCVGGVEEVVGRGGCGRCRGMGETGCHLLPEKCEGHTRVDATCAIACDDGRRAMADAQEVAQLRDTVRRLDALVVQLERALRDRC